MSIERMPSSWNQQNAGGHAGNPTFRFNPAWVFNLKAEIDVQLRICLRSEERGGYIEKDPNKFNYAIYAAIYRTNNKTFPLPPGSVDLSKLRNPSLETANGKYTAVLSGAITKKERLPAGIYMIVASTFDPKQYGTFELILMVGANCYQVMPYKQ